MSIERRYAARVDVYEPAGHRIIGRTDAAGATELIESSQAIARGKPNKPVIHAVLMLPKHQVLERVVVVEEERELDRPRTARQPITRNEAWDNPPRVIKFVPIGRRTREIFLSTLIGRAGILPAADRKRMRRALREAA